MAGGADLSMLILNSPKTFEEQHRAIKELENLVALERIGLIVVDSLVALYRLELREEKIQEVNNKLSRQLAVLSKIARERKIPVLVTNQVYSDFETGDIELVGGNIPKYPCKTLLKLEKTGWGRRKATLMKHRWKPEGKTSDFEIVDDGIKDAEKKFGLF